MEVSKEQIFTFETTIQSTKRKYSFSIQAKTEADAKLILLQELKKVVEELE